MSNLKQTTVKEYFESLTKEERREFQKKVRLLSGLEYYQLRYRLRHNSFSLPELAMINQIVNKEGFVVMAPNWYQPTVLLRQPEHLQLI